MNGVRKDLYLIAGLGNPGPEYRRTRHNMGFRVVGQWALSLGFAMKERRFHSRSVRVSVGDRRMILLCPQTFMNKSGVAVRACADYYQIDPGNILVVHDDIDLPVGRVKVARNGSAGGHKGVQSVIDHLGTNRFARVKVGVGRPTSQQPVEEFVLNSHGADEESVVEEVVTLAIRACEAFVLRGLEQAMNEVNWQILGQKE